MAHFPEPIAHYAPSVGRKKGCSFMIPDLDNSIRQAAVALGGEEYNAAPAMNGEEYCAVVLRCVGDLRLRTDISRERRRKLGAAFQRLLIAFENVRGRVVNLASLISTVIMDTIDELWLKFEFCGMIESAAVSV